MSLQNTNEQKIDIINKASVVNEQMHCVNFGANCFLKEKNLLSSL